MVVPSANAVAPEDRWAALRRGDDEALRLAELEALEIARALAVESLVSDADSELAELAERRRHLALAAWPENPLEGFRLQSSLGAFVVARVAIAWVPSGQTGLRYTPLSPDGVVRALANQGVDMLTAQSVVGQWAGPPKGFRGSEVGLDAGTLAGLAERSLTGIERDEALAQVSVAPRDLMRLGASLALGRAVRRLLPVLASDELGPGFVAALALVATERPDRALELLKNDENTLLGETVRELALTLTHLKEGEPVELRPDTWAPYLPRAEGGTVREPAISSEDLLEDEEAALVRRVERTDFNDDEDVVEMIEESVEGESGAGKAWVNTQVPRLPIWWPKASESSDRELATLWQKLRDHRTLARARGQALGFSAAAGDPRGAPVPPDPRFVDLSEVEDCQAPRLSGSAAEPFLPAVRALLRVVLASAEGDAVDDAEADGLAWVLARATALRRLARGELDDALVALSEYWSDEAPEQRWIRDRKIRFEGRAPEPLSPEEARSSAAVLVLDIARSLARTLTGAFPDSVATD